MASIFTQYSDDLIGHAYQAQDVSSLYYGEPKTNADGTYILSGKSVPKGERIWLSGFTLPYNNANERMYQAFDINNKSCYILSEHIKSGNWLWYTPTQPSAGYSSAVDMVNQLINNNKTILENNLLCAGVIDMLDVANVDIPDDYRRGLLKLQTNLEQRDKQLYHSIFLDKKQTAAPTGFIQYKPQLNEFMNNPGIGVAPVVVVIVVSVVITLLSTAIIYLIFSKSFGESKTDVVYSSDLTSILLKLLPPNVYQRLLVENADNAKKIADKASGNSLLNTVKYLGIGFLGFTLIDKFIQNRNSK